jgi:hypothetical protein
MPDIIRDLLRSDDPSVRYKVLTGVFAADAASREIVALQKKIRSSPRAQSLLAALDAAGRIPGPPYRKWTGAHWVLTLLADLGFPAGDRGIAGLVDQAASWSLGQSAVVISGRPRRCASQQGNLLLAMVKLGYLDERTHELARRLQGWQWQDGGWNCDKDPAATHSSFHETLIPMRALCAYAHRVRDASAATSARRAAEMFLDRRLYRRRTTGAIIDRRFTALHYPYFWRYNILHALVGMAEQGLAKDPRCADALDLLQSKRLPDGGFPAELRYYRVSRDPAARGSGVTTAEWGPVGSGKKARRNDLVTCEALTVFRHAGRPLG